MASWCSYSCYHRHERNCFYRRHHPSRHRHERNCFYRRHHPSRRRHERNCFYRRHHPSRRRHERNCFYRRHHPSRRRHERNCFYRRHHPSRRRHERNCFYRRHHPSRRRHERNCFYRNRHHPSRRRHERNCFYRNRHHPSRRRHERNCFYRRHHPSRRRHERNCFYRRHHPSRRRHERNCFYRNRHHPSRRRHERNCFYRNRHHPSRRRHERNCFYRNRHHPSRRRHERNCFYRNRHHPSRRRHERNCFYRTTPPTTKTSTPTPSTSIPGPSKPCQVDPCEGGSSCVNLHDRHFCLCSEGYYYNSSTCNKGTIFPGTITVKISSTSILEDENSVAYQELYLNITTFFKNAFNNTDYGQTVIGKLSPSPSARSEIRTVGVEVVNIFTDTTKETEENITCAIKKAIANSTTEFTGYTKQDRCDYYGCKKKDAQDDCASGLLCQCKPGLQRPRPQIPLCVALDPKCPGNCNTENKKQCLVKNSREAKCVCLPGYKEDNRGICQPCAFGYSGVDCEDSFQLILTIVGTVAGILFLGMVIALIFSVRSKNKSRNAEEENLIENDFRNLKLWETGFSNLGADGSIFPKIRVNLPKESQPQNPYIVQGGLPRADY
ncbi:mucin-13 [Balaenoptera acutorostrata]|uniref:Mucin-13 n=1 Tax=Balaenoptera acutorostrata TaxID=9767 RepID=A0ABM3TFP4_BALAC|nr:mucin-13 [Balaenoptera acutorostrata]